MSFCFNVCRMAHSTRNTRIIILTRSVKPTRATAHCSAGLTCAGKHFISMATKKLSHEMVSCASLYFHPKVVSLWHWWTGLCFLERSLTRQYLIATCVKVSFLFPISLKFMLAWPWVYSLNSDTLLSRFLLAPDTRLSLLIKLRYSDSRAPIVSFFQLALLCGSASSNIVA